MTTSPSGRLLTPQGEHDLLLLGGRKNTVASMLKYAAHLSQCPEEPCPNPGKFTPKSRIGFRWVHKDATDHDFVPTSIQYGAKPGARCETFALSFFVDLESARVAYAALMQRLAKRVDVISRHGDHIAEISLQETDGLMGQPNPKGHFDLHPEDGVTFSHRVANYNAAAV